MKGNDVMINNFMCDSCGHVVVCDKLKSLMKFHETAKLDLGIELTMDSCEDYAVDSGNQEDS